MKDIRPLLANVVQLIEEVKESRLLEDHAGMSYSEEDVEAMIEELNETFNQIDSEFND